MGYARKFLIRLKNAKAVVRQLNNGEWSFCYNEIMHSHPIARREGRELWVSNGGFFCDVDEENAFGFLFRHYVWWAAARRAKQEADKGRKNPRELPPTLYDEGE